MRKFKTKRFYSQLEIVEIWETDKVCIKTSKPSAQRFLYTQNTLNANERRENSEQFSLIILYKKDEGISNDKD